MVTVVVQNASDLKKENDAVRSKKERVAPDPLIISDCEAAAEIAAKLIPKHHHELAGANIVYLCRNKAAKSAGKLVPGQVKKASPTDAHISRAYFNKSDMSGEDSQEAHFIMTIALEVWNNLQPNQRTALIDHLLTRCVGVEDEKSGEMKYGIRPPQIQEFAEVAERHGRWNDDLSELGDCLKGK
jgi:hypothetical protein